MKMALFFVKWHDTFEIFISLGTLGFTIHQFIKTKKLKKIEKKLLLYSKFFYLESLLSTNLEKLKKILENGNQLSELSLQELAASYKLVLQCSMLYQKYLNCHMDVLIA